MALRFFFNDDDTVTVPTTLPFVGIYIPIVDLPGMDATELSTVESVNRKEGKVVFSIVQKLYQYLSVNTNTLSLRMSIGNPAIISSSLIALSYSLIVDYLTNVSNGTNSMIPEPISGVYSGIGDVSLREIFPNCFKVESTNNTADASGIGASGAGVLVSTEDLSQYGFFNDVANSTLATLNITADNRYAIASIMQCICDGNISIRSSSTASGITSTLVSAASTVVIPANYYASSNPLTNISAANLDHLSITRRTYSITFELTLDPQVLEINNVTTV
jgi:hypothetical protein